MVVILVPSGLVSVSVFVDTLVFRSVAAILSCGDFSEQM